ncbi:ClC family H(+)/Cl(-) exchange transporter [Paenibacillus sp. YN15]|uniref:ClC family H(+)/Cl(-) exchange transporter n=1 Tax=Paenibacillus sp. YN15 TaxID=1742774 RepID=UPI000DCDC492|nr:ClC family H(+)/Cl(-) exchange transporter [Paenibacillus sp. YN15]RAV04688.1 ClC family H(+)/Cl(-) exchange transporter [Paenibacillus sp. YN15]
MNEENSARGILHFWHGTKFRLIALGLGVGLAAGIVVVLYRYVIELSLEFSLQVYGYLRERPWYIPLWFVVLALCGWLTGRIVGRNPIVSGSGIPQVKGILQRKLAMNWWKTVLAKFAGGALSIGAGLSLGREGPSIQIGSAIGMGFSKLLHKPKVTEHFLITCGASAGLAAAFNAPIAGAVFALEELHNSFSPVIMITALASSIVADMVSKEFFGLQPIFEFRGISAIPLAEYGHLIVLGIILGFAGLLFNVSLCKAQDVYKRLKLPLELRMILPFLVAGCLGLVLPQVLGGGNHLVNSLLTDNRPLLILAVILAAKYLFTMISYGSSAPGGIFLPMLALGALIGLVYSKAWGMATGAESFYAANFIILAMAGFFAAVVKAPMTGIILLTEMTGSFSNLLSMGLVCLAAYVTADALGSKPVYELLLHRYLSNKGVPGYTAEEKHKVLLEIAVHPGSPMDRKRIRDIRWPDRCLVVGIQKGSSEVIPTGSTRIASGDSLVVLADEDTASQVESTLAGQAASKFS